MLTLIFACAVAACSTDLESPDDSPLDPGPTPTTEPRPTYADADYLFEPDRLLTVDIDIAPRDWDQVRFQTRHILGLFGDNCGAGPAGSPFTYVPATVTVEGQVMDNVGVRKKGFLGSLDDVKPSLKIKFNEYQSGQRLSGLKRMTLNNAKQDPSYVNQCLGYRVFEQAGVPAPRCNFAHVRVNGESLGVYVHVESVKKPFIARYFADNDGNLYEGTLSDFRAGWSATFERKTNKSDPPGSEDRSDLAAVEDALALDDAAMLARLDELIDMDAFYSFWAVETMLAHWDGYAGNNNNYFVYGDPDSGKFTFMPWGADQLFGDSFGTTDPGLTRSALTRRLYQYGPSRERYLARFGEILDQVWDDADLLAELDRIAALIESSIPADERERFEGSLDQVHAAIDGREQRMRDELAVAGPDDADELAEPLCFDRSGDISATFSATFGGDGSTSATMNVTVEGAPLTLTSVSAVAGPSDEVEGQSVIYLVGATTDNRTAIAFISLPDDNVAPGVINLNDARAEAALLLFPEGSEEPDAVYFLDGTMTLDAGSASPGATWQGSADLTLWDPPFF